MMSNMPRSASMQALADCLERVSAVERATDAEDLLQALPKNLHPDAVAVLANVGHYVSDFDLRKRRTAYREMQEKEMQDLIRALRREATLPELLDHTFLA